MATFAERLKELRKEKKLTQLDIAKRLGISTGSVGMWESGKRNPSFDNVMQLADMLDTNVDYLLGTSDKRFTQADEQMSDQQMQDLGNKAEDDHREFQGHVYSLLDPYGKSMVDAVISEEYRRCTEQGTLKQVFPSEEEIKESLAVIQDSIAKAALTPEKKNNVLQSIDFLTKRIKDIRDGKG